jgi:hypothetical protein
MPILVAQSRFYDVWTGTKKSGLAICPPGSPAEPERIVDVRVCGLLAAVHHFVFKFVLQIYYEVTGVS